MRYGTAITTLQESKQRLAASTRMGAGRRYAVRFQLCTTRVSRS